MFLLNFLSILHEKTYFFYFTLSLLQNTHISLSILQDISIKYSFFSIFFIISLNYPLPTYAHTLSLFLLIFSEQITSLSLFYLLSFFLKNYQPRSLLHRVLSSPADPDPFFTGRSMNQAPRPRSFLHRPIHEPSSGDPDPLFTGRSVNQAPRPRSFLHRLIHEPSSTTQITSSPADPRTKLHKHRSISLLVCLCGFVCGCVSVLICLCGCVCVWVCLCASEEKKMRS